MARAMSLNIGIVKGLKHNTNILDIKVPPRLRERYKCGISWVDDGFGGDGFVPSSVHMITGMPGTGKSTLVRQLADALTVSDYVCLYNTGEESLFQVKMACERLNIKKGFYCANHTMTSELLEHADKLAKENKGKQVFILQDSLATLDDGKYKDGGTTGNTSVRCCEQLVEWAKETFGIVMFVGQCTKNGDFAGKNVLKHMVDTHGHLYFDIEKKSETYGERLFEVNKNRWGVTGRIYIIGMERNGLYEKGSFSFVKD